MKQVKKSTVATALGAVVIGSFAAGSALASGNPFEMETLPAGYSQVAAEGSCGGNKTEHEGKCGGDKAEKEGKCGEGKCGGDKAKKEGKCGEGKCGGAA